MYGMLEQEISRQHREEIQQQVAAYRPGKPREPRRKFPPGGRHQVGSRTVRGLIEEAPARPRVARTERTSTDKSAERKAEMSGGGLTG
jgi:hypothetical protein